ncbi:hypothetical protein GTO87_02940 [Ligilactobacillus saerimneri]|uniref:Phage protein n=1 Tax=Ligilactobacillus saerimneri TaxID=228229 RepID=A0A7H9EK31_9LACO|nr:hypothetical protein [Ligilactobacillus saerimneri]QLL77647.1 hypothetical protein GTO87_02940 [Ligilactobacillus saerimneri]
MKVTYKNNMDILDGDGETVLVDGRAVGTFVTYEEGFACVYYDGAFTDDEITQEKYKQRVGFGDYAYNTAKRKLRALLKAFA